MASVIALGSLLTTQALWHAGRTAAVIVEGGPTGYAVLDALLLHRGCPHHAIDALLPADDIDQLALLMPTLAVREHCEDTGGVRHLIAHERQDWSGLPCMHCRP